VKTCGPCTRLPWRPQQPRTTLAPTTALMAQTTLATSASASTVLSLTSTPTTPTWVVNRHSAGLTPPQHPSSTRLSNTTWSPDSQLPTLLEGPALIAQDPASTVCAVPATAHVPPSKQVATSLLLLTCPASRVVTPQTDRTREKVATALTAQACKLTMFLTHENLRQAGGTTSVKTLDER
jgi:hypothetical protein